MPALIRWYVKSALVFFVAALLVGVLRALEAQFPFLPPDLEEVYYHLLLVGWITQMIVGVAFWMFPKFTLAKPRGSESLAWITYGLLNLGLVLRVISEPLNKVQPGAVWSSLLILSALMLWLAGCTFVANIWRRVKLK
jgi:hypothetical protein